jgi:antitoxin HigA-1
MPGKKKAASAPAETRNGRNARPQGLPANAIHPGEMLREEFMTPLGLTSYRLAKELRIPAPRVNDIVLEKRGITADTALRLARYFGNTPEFWMNMQAHYDLALARANGKEISKIKPRNEAA